MNTRTSGIFSGDSLGSACVSIPRATVVEIRYDRYGSRATAMRSFERASEVLREHPEVCAAVFNTTSHSGHDPGNTALGVRWMNEFRGQLRRAAIVTRSQGIATLANIGKVMCPWLEVRAFTTYEDALAWCEQPAARSDTSQTGVRPVGGRGNSAA